jgi:hypothetical protein
MSEEAPKRQSAISLDDFGPPPELLRTNLAYENLQVSRDILAALKDINQTLQAIDQKIAGFERQK